jgi:AcrR family transcriptional regulator
VAEPESTLAWRSRPERDDAEEQVLDAAGRCFARQGIRATSLSDIAREAGCSRPTVYRYFDGRDAVRAAFVRREARRIGAGLRERIDLSAPPATWVTDAVLGALHDVRSDAVLSAWFRADDVGSTLSLATRPEMLSELAHVLVAPATDSAAPTDDPSAARADDLAEWVVRVILSFLSSPAADEATERRLVERFLTPVLLR